MNGKRDGGRSRSADRCIYGSLGELALPFKLSLFFSAAVAAGADRGELVKRASAAFAGSGKFTNFA
jgi:hypothetical protein